MILGFRPVEKPHGYPSTSSPSSPRPTEIGHGFPEQILTQQRSPGIHSATVLVLSLKKKRSCDSLGCQKQFPESLQRAECITEVCIAAPRPAPQCQCRAQAHKMLMWQYMKTSWLVQQWFTDFPNFGNMTNCRWFAVWMSRRIKFYSPGKKKSEQKNIKILIGS